MYKKKIDIDPNKVIKVEPKMVREDFKSTNDGGFSKYFWKGFFGGWMSFYLLLKLLGKI
jgi:hypothetical protein